MLLILFGLFWGAEIWESQISIDLQFDSDVVDGTGAGLRRVLAIKIFLDGSSKASLISFSSLVVGDPRSNVRLGAESGQLLSCSAPDNSGRFNRSYRRPKLWYGRFDP